MTTRNLLSDLPGDADAEAFERLAGTEAVRIERIVSRGHRSPASGWYEQAQAEWVALLQGEAMLVFEDGERLHLRVGDWVDIPARRRHRVEWTAADAASVWLAVHYPADD
ncbi:cupin domain-containing protein [Acidihalobacter prosperus]|uniref:Cupin n=1 Tax=Acidihalobacter prosperus TaxID=160660 RepID=A0A1A6C697_9GAMM|nr:cupin domain-containing protein [Acidihalobacter prosperus]OBS10089.1 cupin [Acidihalobacter prosperus]